MDQKQDVLVVEDDEALNSIVCRFVKLAGFTVRGALDGESAFRAIEERLPSLVLLDLMLPDTTGFAICQQLKHTDRTAMADDESRKRGLACGAVAYLTKPFDPDQLIGMIRDHVAKTAPVAA
jgi:DNA-binding response OmpR family regulator